MRITRAALLLTAFALFLAAYLVVRFDDPAVPPAVPIVFLVALALPSYVALVRWLAGGNPASLPVLIYPAVPLPSSSRRASPSAGSTDTSRTSTPASGAGLSSCTPPDGCVIGPRAAPSRSAGW